VVPVDRLDRDALVTATEAASRLKGVTIERIIGWRNSGKVDIKDYRIRGRRRYPLYRWGDLADVEQRTRRSPHNLHHGRAASEAA
jgi:hypothetical protein